MGALVESPRPRWARWPSTMAVAALVTVFLGCDVQPGDLGEDSTAPTTYEEDPTVGMPSSLLPATPEPEE